jgi:hypothetical protein
MATGDIQFIKKLGSVLLPGGGQTTTGGKKQNKVLVWGHINCDDYDQDKGLDLAEEVSDPLHALGVATLDFIDFQVVSEGLTEAMADDSLYLVNLDRPDMTIWILEDVGADTPAGPGDDDNVSVRYWAIGDAPDKDVT